MLKRSQNKGFTLIEILIALAIFAVIGIAAAVCLHQMINYRTRLTAQADQWRELAIARLLIQKDYSNAVNLSDKDLWANLLPKFSGQSGQVTLTRWNHQQASWVKQTPMFIGVTYSLSGQNLVRTIKSATGQAMQNVIAQHVTSLNIKYLNHAKQWMSSWNIVENSSVHNQSPSHLPSAIRVILNVVGVGAVQWDFSKPVVSG